MGNTKPCPKGEDQQTSEQAALPAVHCSQKFYLQYWSEWVGDWWNCEIADSESYLRSKVAEWKEFLREKRESEKMRILVKTVTEEVIDSF